MFNSKTISQIDGDDIDLFLSNDIELQPDIYDFDKIKLRKLIKDKNKKKYIEHILENKDILNFDDEDLYNEISKNFSDADVVDLIFKLLSKRIKNINERALTFRDNIIKKYRYLHNPQKIIEKANKYMRYLNLSPEEKTIFINSFKKNFKTPLTGEDYKGPKELQNQLNSISKFFNYNAKKSGKLNFENSDIPIIKEIISLVDSNNEMYNINVSNILKLHKEITTNGIKKYYDGVWVNRNAKITDCVPPIIFALFANVYPTIDKYMLISNIGMLIKKSYEHRILNEFEQNVIDSLAHDTDEYIDKSGNTLTVAQDLLYRTKIQISLWKIVLFLRTKHIFDCDCSTFYKLMSIYSPDILNNKDNDICGDSIDIMSKIFNIVNFKPIKIQYSYTIGDEASPAFGEASPIVIKQGRDNTLYMFESKKLDLLNKDLTDYYRNLNKNEKIPFIYIKQSENAETSVDFNSDVLEITFGRTTQILDQIKHKPYLGKKITKKSTIESIDNILIFVVIRTQTIINKQNKIYINNQPLIYDVGSYNTKFNINKVTFGDISNGVYANHLDHNGVSYYLSSVLLYSVYNESIENDPNSGLKVRGNPYSLVINHSLTSGKHSHIIYQPYVLNTFSHSMDNDAPLTAFNLSYRENNQRLTEIVQRYGEIYIFRNLEDKLIDISYKYDNSVKTNPPSSSGQSAVKTSSGLNQTIVKGIPKSRTFKRVHPIPVVSDDSDVSEEDDAETGEVDKPSKRKADGDSADTREEGEESEEDAENDGEGDAEVENAEESAIEVEEKPVKKPAKKLEEEEIGSKGSKFSQLALDEEDNDDGDLESRLGRLRQSPVRTETYGKKKDKKRKGKGRN